MKKKLIGLLLVLCLLVGAIPAFGITSAAEDAAQNYDSLYVQNGLVMNLTYRSGVDLTAGTWASTVGGKTATLMNSELWKQDAIGGLYFDIETRMDAGDTAVGINMGIENLPDRSFTVEMVARGTGLTVGGDGVTPVTTTGVWGYQCGRSFAFGPLKGEGFPMQRDPDYSKYTYDDYSTGTKVTKQVTEADIESGATYVKDTNGGTAPISSVYYYTSGNLYAYNEVRWFYSEGATSWQETFNNHGTYGLTQENMWKNTGLMNTGVVRHTRSDASSSYQILSNGTALTSVNAPISSWTKGDKVVIEKADDQEFVLFRSMPAHIYFVRVYDRVLSDDELAQNHFADIMSYYGMDLAALKDLGADKMKSLYTMFKTADFDSNKSDIEALFSATAGGEGGFDAENSLYVTDGLTSLFSSFGEFKSSLKLTKNGGMWVDQITGNIGTLKGANWTEKELGGVSWVATFKDWSANHDYGLTLGTPFLPEEDFCVEMVINPKGISNEDGSRYVDNVSTYGTYLDNGFAFGPLKAMTFVCIRPAGKDGQLEHRWVYLSNGCWNASGFKSLCTESVFSRSDGVKAITFTVSHDRKGEPGNYESNYKIYYQFEMCGQIEKWGDGYIPKEGAEGLFNVMYGIPGDIYAVRVYNRQLTVAEMLQNHVADLVYCYGLDTDLLNQALSAAADPREVYEAFSEMSFNLTVEEARKEFQDKICSLWVTADGISARIDNKAGLRAVFSLNSAIISGMEASGYSFEIGALINVNKDGYPTLEANDTRIVVYKDGEKNEAFFLDDDTFAAGVQLKFPDQALMMKDVNFAYYVIVHKDGAEDITLTGNVTCNGFRTNGFDVYSKLESGAYSKNAYVKALVASCYDVYDISVGEDGDKLTVAEAVAEAIRLFGESGGPISVSINLEDGVHQITEPIVIDSDDWTNQYFRLAIVGGDAEDVKITGATEIDAAGFRKVEGKDYYMFQFEKDGDGNYPAFRTFYVNGVIATLSHSGSLYYADGDDGGIPQQTMPFELGFDARMGTDILKNEKGGYLSTADQLAAINASPYKASNKFYIHEELIKDPNDIAQLEFHVQTQWDFNIMHITNIDVSDCIKDDNGKNCVAAYFRTEERASFQLPGNYPLKGRQYVLENSLSFVDEPGEYYYDVASGKLYYYPAEDVDMANATFEVPVTDQLLIFDGMRNVTVKGITFTGTDDYFLQKYGHSGGQAGGDQRTREYYASSGSFPERSALFFRNGIYGLTIAECVFDNLPCEAITMRNRMEHVTIDSNRFFNIGATAIRMADGSANWDANTGLYDVYVYNNYINRTGWSIRQCCATQFGSAKDLTIEYNTILYSSYTAISIGWRWQTVNWMFGSQINLMNVNVNSNYIAHFMLDEKDGGAIYTLGGNVDPSYTEYFNYLYQNYIVFTKDTGCQGMVCGLYHDGSSSNWYDSENVIVAASPVNTRQPESYYHYIYIQHIDGQETHNVLSEHNYVINLKATDYDEQMKEVYRNYLTTKNAETRNIMADNTVMMKGLDELWDSDVPTIVDCVGSEFCIPDIADIENNDF